MDDRTSVDYYRREIVISALREWMAEQGKRGEVAVSQLGKVKTAAQMLAIIAPIWQFSRMVTLSYILLYIATILTFGSWCSISWLRAIAFR